MSEIPNVILTGAGASYGSGVVTPYPPPLGFQLYAELEQFAPQLMTQISSIIGTENKEDFEKKMHEIMESKKINAPVLNAAIASYFARFSPSVFGNHYVELFQNLFQENIEFVYSTLNYDCIAELAASQAGRSVNYNIDSMNTGKFNVLKLHGSSNFLLKGISGRLGSISFGVGSSMIDGGIEVVQPNQVQQLVQNRPAGPCMSYYMKDKPTAVGQRTIQAIQKKWIEFIKNSEKIVIIGTNVNLEDNHIWEPIMESNADIGFVGNQISFSVLESSNQNRKVELLGDRFENAVTNIVGFFT